MQKDFFKQIILHVNEQGTIERIVQNTFPDLDVQKGETPLHLFEKNSHFRYFDHFSECKDFSISNGYKANTIHNSEVFVFMIHQNELIYMYIIGINEETQYLFDELIKINNEQIRSIRNLYRKLAHKEDKYEFLEEIMHVNNELINTRRELSSKNRQLENLNKKLQTINYTDYLTNLPNRRKFFEDIYRLVKTNDYELTMMDFNNFKIINDQFGHNIGDQALRIFANKIQEEIIPYDGITYRLGGDEFACLVKKGQGIDYQDLFSKVDKKIQKIHDLTSTSYGTVVVTLDNCNQQHKAEISMAKADALMYKMKQEFYKTHDIKRI